MMARPPTTAPPPGYWRRADSHYPRPLSPLGRSVLLPAANGGFRAMCETFGLLAETVEEREIGGWVYMGVVPLGGRARRAPPPWVVWLLARLSPSLRSRLAVCVDAVRTDEAGRQIDRWSGEWLPDLEARLDRLRKVDLGSLSDTELDWHLEAVVGLLEKSQRVHMSLNHSVNLLLAEYVFAASDLLCWDDDRALGLLMGLSEMSTAPARAVAKLADVARHCPTVTAALARESDPKAVLAADPAFATAFGRFQRTFGARTLEYDVAGPTLAERPDLILSQVRDRLRDRSAASDRAPVAGGRERALESARRALATRPPEDRARFDHVLRRAERAYPVREEHGFFDTMMPLALARAAALELGRRLAARDQLAAPGDVFWLEIDEARAALASGAVQLPVVEERERALALALARPGPASYGAEPAAPALGGLPDEAQFVHRAVQWAYQRVFEPAAATRRQPDPAAVRGIGASPGRFTGRVRRVRDEADLDRVQPGEVLVSPTASPVWSVLFPRLGALVTDTGGSLSHCAIIAREFGLPAVVGTGTATQHLQDGQTVTVDGGAGTVVIQPSLERTSPCRASSSST